MNVYEFAELRAILAQDERYCGHSIATDNDEDAPAYTLSDPDGKEVAIIECMFSLWKPDECWWLFVPEAAPDSIGMPSDWVEGHGAPQDALRYLLNRLAEHRSAHK